MPEAAAAQIPPDAMLGAMVFLMGINVLLFVALWKIFVKAGQDGWKALVPVYNLVVLSRLCGKPGWWAALLLVPLISIVFLVLLCLALARSFGKGGWFAAGVAFLPWVFLPVLAFSSDPYYGPGGEVEEAPSADAQPEEDGAAG